MDTRFTDLPTISRHVYNKWVTTSTLATTCSREFEGEFDIENREIDIPVYGEYTLHKSTVLEMKTTIAPIEFQQKGTIRVTIGKTRYNHYGTTKLSKLLDKFNDAEGHYLAKIGRQWANDMDEGIAIACARLGAKRHLDMYALLGNQVISKDNITKMFQILKAKIKVTNGNIDDFDFFASEKIHTIAEDAQLTFYSNPAKEAFMNGYKGKVSGVEVTELNIEALVKRNADTALVEAEYGILKTYDGIQLVVPFKATETYELQKDKVMFGGEGAYSVEMYDYFNIYPERLYVVDLKYVDNATFPTYGTNGNANVQQKTNLTSLFGTVKGGN